MDKIYLGWPVVTAKNVFDVVRELGIKPWREMRPDAPLSQWLRSANAAEGKVYAKYGSKQEVQFLAPPESMESMPDAENVFFSVKYNPFVTVFAPVPSEDGQGWYVPITAEWKQGNRLITLVPPSGIAGKAEVSMGLLAAMHSTATREFREETGFSLEAIELLGSANGFYDQVRSADLRFFPFLGHVRMSTERGKSKLDKNEFLKLVLFPIKEWLTLLEGHGVALGFGLEACAVTTTYLALRKLQHIPLFADILAAH